jgi:hypothetical protein
MAEPLAAVDEPAPAVNAGTQAAHASDGLFDEVSARFKSHLHMMIFG